MATLNVTLPEGASICNGKQVTFRAPCDCAGVTGIIIEGVTYALLDTTDTPIDTGNAFVAGALVTVVIDDENKKAYIQNGGAGGGGAAVPRRVIVTLKASDWDSDTKTQIVPVFDLSADENSQLVHILPNDNEAYTECGITASVYATGSMKFTAETIPTVDHVVKIITEDVGSWNPEAPQEVVTGSEAKRFIADVPVNWTESDGLYYQDISIDGMLHSYEPICDYMPSDDHVLNEQYKAAWGNVCRVDTSDNAVRIWCTSVPTIEFQARFTVIGWYTVGETYPVAEGVEF